MKTFLIVLTLLVVAMPSFASFDAHVNYPVGDGPNSARRIA